MSEFNLLKTIRKTPLGNWFDALAVALTFNGVVHNIQHPTRENPKDLRPDKIREEIVRKTGDLAKGPEIYVEGPPLDNSTYHPTMAEWTKLIGSVSNTVTNCVVPKASIQKSKGGRSIT